MTRQERAKEIYSSFTAKKDAISERQKLRSEAVLRGEQSIEDLKEAAVNDELELSREAQITAAVLYGIINSRE